MKSALSDLEEALLNAEIVKLLPNFMAPTVGGLLVAASNRTRHSSKA
jgi:hypothetical protein